MDISNNLCGYVPHLENCRTLQNPPEIAQVSRSQATGHNYEALFSLGEETRFEEPEAEKDGEPFFSVLEGPLPA